MKKVKYFIIAAAVILTATVLLKGSVSAAEVTKINIGKGHVYIDEGKDAGFILGADVCFYSSSGEKIECGRVRQTLPSRAMVQLKSREAKKVKKGMEARVETGEERVEEVR
jgi:hypothetical protein